MSKIIGPATLFSDWVVGIGASAGGLEALGQFVSNLPKEFGGTVIVAQHLAPHSKSMMVELLSRQTNFPVRQAENNLKLQPGTIYIVPPNHDLDLVDSHMILRVAEEAIRPKPSVDEFFESLAKSHGDKCVGIILSGTGSDGSRGIQAIKDAGGITLAQDDQSAKYDGMPRSAVGTGKVDTILPPESLAKNIIKTIQEHETRKQSSKINRRFDTSYLEPIFDLIRERLGQDFRFYKASTIVRRINKRMAQLGFQNHEKYIEHLKATPGEIRELSNELLISVTQFFRDPEVFQELRHKLLARISKMPGGEEFRAWVAGCATGEEAYTYAMMILDIQDELKKTFPVKIFATDLDHDAIQEARMGIYPLKDIKSVPPAYLDRFFQNHSHETVELTKRVRDCVVFAKQDLIQNPPFVKLHLVSCRNVMIYFESELQRRVLEIFHYALLPSGILVLGKSESILTTPQLFECLDKKNKIFERLNVPSLGLPTTKVLRSAFHDMPVASRGLTPFNNLAEVGFKKLIKAYNIAGAIVDSDSTLIQVYGDVSPYVQFQNQADLKLTNLLPKGVGVELPILIRKVLEQNEPHRSRTHRVGKGAKGIAFQIVVRPLNDDDDHDKKRRGLVLVTFEQTKIKEFVKVTEIGQSETPNRLAELEQELFVTKEHLQTVIEELGVSNEELQSLNEELSSTNEELQASNEELETTNEELQSSNEELTTVNEELVAKGAELRAVSLSLENIQNSIGSPLLVLDTKLRLIRYNSDATKLFYVSEGDIGREFLRISSRCEIPDFLGLAKEALNNARPGEVNCEANGSIYQLRVLPSFDENNRIIGLVLVFNDATERLRIHERLIASEERTRAIIEASPSLISLKDNLGRYLLVNSSFKKFFGITTDIIGKTDREILPEKLANQLRDVDLEVFIKRDTIHREETIDRPNGQKSTLLANRFPLMDINGKNPIAVGTIAIDITSQEQAQRALEKSEALYRAIAEDQAVIVCRHKPTGEFTYVNQFFAHYFGSIPQEMRGKSFVNVIDPEDRAVVNQLVSTISARQPVIQHEHKVYRLNSEKRWMRWIHRGIFDREGELIEIQSVGFDVTDYRSLADQSKQKEAIFAGVYDNTTDFISIYKIVGQDIILESLNHSAEQALGTLGNQLVGRKLQDFFALNESSETIAKYWNAVRERKSQVFEEEVLISGVVRHFLTTIVPIPNANGEIDKLAAISRDVSTYKRIELDLRQAKESADIASRAKSDFLASMSHELRTPLNVVLGFCQMLELSRLDSEQLNYVNGIHRSGQLLLTLIEDILDISKIEAGKIKLESIPFSMPDLISSAAELFTSQAAEKGIKLHWEVSENAATNVMGDPNRLRQVLVNFIGNSIKFTSKGSIEITVEARGTQNSAERMFRISVKDTGIGIREQDKEKIFQKFSQAETGHARRFGGSGLGLAICKNLVGVMGGRVGFDSEFNRGSTFWFEVPLMLTGELPMTNLHQKISTTNQVSSRRLHVLIVDDNLDSRTVAELFLKRLGHTYTSVETGHLAINELSKNTFDLVLMDMQMPEMDGCETTVRIRNGVSKDIPIIALTANALMEDVDRCFAAGMNDYISKPVRLDELSAMLNKWSVKVTADNLIDGK